MDKILLIRPSEDLESKAVAYKREHFEYGENTINGSKMWDKAEDYRIWLETVRKNTDKDRL
ncbi:MAG: hypothetical protein FWE80_07785 [Oscillospiraceae bacterium]|nr:hypothetical protein [Oscillospiraceae bacterium]